MAYISRDRSSMTLLLKCPSYKHVSMCNAKHIYQCVSMYNTKNVSTCNSEHVSMY